MNYVENYLLNCHISPECRVAANELVTAVRLSIPADERRQWTRRRILTEFAALGFPFGVAGDHKTYVIGLTLDRPPRWAVADGRLVKV